MLTTEHVLVTIAGHLSATGLAQYDANANYLNSEIPSILFADSDVPDCCLVLSVVDQDAALGQWDVQFAWRTTGITPRSVETLADGVFDHFRSVLGVRATNVVWSAGTITDLPSLLVPGLLEWTEAERVSRGTAELTSQAKHNGSRFVRRDTYRMTMLPN